ncbi:MAG: DUF6644 family protein [Leptolyngbyaceae cyanobacterium bins.302]|nr:DUF6644 family protein [Leptolyngbyaceae cyanobacterium bins.302]
MVATTGWEWLENSAVPTAIRQWSWGYPLLEVIHILGLAVLFGSVAMFDLRLLGVSRHLLVTDLARHLLPWTYFSFAIVALSGGLLFSTDATQIAANPAFQLKLGLIAAAGVNATLFHRGIYRSVQLWNRAVPVPVSARITAVLSLLLWAAVITCGRLIAYL